MLEARILQAARLKGRLSLDAGIASAAVSAQEAAAEMERLRYLGLLKGENSVRITAEGKERLAGLIASERESLDQEALMTGYHEFDDYNSRLKNIVSDWQLRAGAPNDHTDRDYDLMVLERLTRLHADFLPLLERIAGIAPRLAPYVGRFDHAMQRVQAGNHTFVARPITDSYHTVWFEFHEELIGLLGLSRQEEAAAGRAV